MLIEWNNGWEEADWDDEKFDRMVWEMNDRIKLQKVCILMRFKRKLIKQKFQKRNLAERMNKKKEEITNPAEKRSFLKEFIMVSTSIYINMS